MRNSTSTNTITSSEDDEVAPLLRNGASGVASPTAVLYNESSSAIPLPSSTLLEPPNQKRSRWRSIRVMYFTMFMSSVTFTMTMSTLWPFLQVVDVTATPSFLGWVVAGYSLGQLVASPLFGLWSAKRKAREPLVVSLILQVGGNVFYAYIQSIPGSGGEFMLLSRIIMGLASGNAAVVRAYVSGATTLAERIGAMTMVSIWQSVGFILGPVIQTALVSLSYPGPLEKKWFHFNMYTSPAFLAAVLAAANFVLLITVFQLHEVDDSGKIGVAVNNRNDDDGNQSDDNDSNIDEGPPDYVAVVITMFLFFIVFFMFTIFETIGTPLLMDMYGWSKAEAALYMGIILASAGILAIVVFIIIKTLAKKGVDERILLIAGYCFCFVGFFTYLPWGHDLPSISFAPVNPSAITLTTSSVTVTAPTVVPPWQPGQLPALQRKLNEISEHGATYNSLSTPHQQLFFARSRWTSEQNSRLTNTLSSKREYDNHLLTRTKSGRADMSRESRQSAIKLPNMIKLSAEAVAAPVQSAIVQQRKQSSPSTASTESSGAKDTWLVATTPDSNSTSNTTVTPEGCPWTFGWCQQVPKVRLFQFILGTAFIAIGYPICNVITYSLFSKVLGPQPQGLWMGFLTACGSLARTLGPIFVAQIYDAWGPRVTFASSCGILVLTIAISVISIRRLIPFAITPFRKRRHTVDSVDSDGVLPGPGGSLR